MFKVGMIGIVWILMSALLYHLTFLIPYVTDKLLRKTLTLFVVTKKLLANNENVVLKKHSYFCIKWAQSWKEGQNGCKGSAFVSLM